MRPLASRVTVSLSIVVFVLVGGLSYAEEGPKYEVTITNVTRGQIISPPIVISHNRHFQLFALGEPARLELVALAEDGLTDPLAEHVATSRFVLDAAVASEPLMPGASVTLDITTAWPFSYLSAAGMLVTTNDAFFAIRGVRVPWRGERTVHGEAYDAGSEVNSESCDYIPGPPCGKNGARDPEGAEGYVHIHAGIHATGDLDPAMHNWHNPVVEVTIRRMD